MKILFFLESLHGGGKERRSVELIRYLVEQPERYEIELVLTEDEIHYEEIHETGVKIHFLRRQKMKYDPGVIFRFMNICKQFNPDIIHAWGKMSTFYSIPSKLALGIPVLSSLIADSRRSYGTFSRYALLLKFNVSFSDMVLANSIAGLKSYSIPESKGRVVYNGVRLSRFENIHSDVDARTELGISTRFMVIMVATFSSFKDYDLFVDVARESGRLRRDVTFVAVGNGPDFERIRSRIYDEGIRNTVLTGRRTDIERLVSAADVGLLCTKAEGISNSIIEYMACGKPAIATDTVGGSRELIIDGETGYCTERDAVRTASLISCLLDNRKLREAMGQKGRERIFTHFSIARMGQEFQSVYKELLAGRLSPAVEKAAGA